MKKEEIRKAICGYSHVQCVYKTPKQKFFIFRKNSGGNTTHPYYKELKLMSSFWTILDKDKLIIPPFGNTESHRAYKFKRRDPVKYEREEAVYRKHNQEYKNKYGKKILNSPVFIIENILKSKKITLNSPQYVRPIRDLMRDVRMLPEKRGSRTKKDERQKMRDKFILLEYKKIVNKRKGKKRPYPVGRLLELWAIEVNRKFSSNTKEAEKYYGSASTVRRILDKFNGK